MRYIFGGALSHLDTASHCSSLFMQLTKVNNDNPIPEVATNNNHLKIYDGDKLNFVSNFSF